MTHKSFWARCGYFITTNPLIILLITLIYTVGLMSQIPSVKIDLGLEVLYDENDPGLLKPKELHDIFGNDQIATVMIKVNDMYDLEVLSKLKKFIPKLKIQLPS